MKLSTAAQNARNIMIIEAIFLFYFMEIRNYKI